MKRQKEVNETSRTVCAQCGYFLLSSWEQIRWKRRYWEGRWHLKEAVLKFSITRIKTILSTVNTFIFIWATQLIAPVTWENSKPQLLCAPTEQFATMHQYLGSQFWDKRRTKYEFQKQMSEWEQSCFNHKLLSEHIHQSHFKPFEHLSFHFPSLDNSYQPRGSQLCWVTFLCCALFIFSFSAHSLDDMRVFFSLHAWNPSTILSCHILS